VYIAIFVMYLANPKQKAISCNTFKVHTNFDGFDESGIKLRATEILHVIHNGRILVALF